MNQEIHEIEEWEILTPSGWSDFSAIKKITKEFSYLLSFTNGKILRCSDRHKLKKNNKRFVYAKNLKIGDRLFTGEILIEKQKIQEEIELFDLLDVEKNNEYFTNDIVSHNCAFIPHMETIWTSVSPILSTGGDCIILSTPNGATDWFCEMYTKAEQRLFGDDELKFEAMKLPYQLRAELDNDWFKGVLAQKATMTKRQFAQEFECKFQGSGNNIVDLDIIQQIHKPRFKDPLRTMFNESLWIWEEPLPDETYVIGADVARGDGSDFSTFSILKKVKEPEKMVKVASFKAQVQTNIFAGFLAEIGNFYNNALLCIENNSVGWSVLMELQNLEYTNIYYSVKGQDFNKFINPNNPAYKRVKNKLMVRAKKDIEMVMGFTTSNKTRPVILDNFAIKVENDLYEFYSTRLEKEIQGWIWKNGRYDHEEGNEDDIIMGDAIGCFVLDQLDKVDYYDNQSQGIRKQFNEFNKQVKDSKVSAQNTFSAIQKKRFLTQTKIRLDRSTSVDLTDLYDCKRYQLPEKEEEC